MNKIQEVKQRANIVEVAYFLGLKLNRANKCVCPFHKEKTASFSISPQKQIFHCFGCNKGGDVISLVEELLNVNAYEAAKQINTFLHLGVDFGKSSNSLELNKYKQKSKAKEEFKKWENETFQLLCDYYHFTDDYNELAKVEYFLEVFINGTDKEKLEFYKYYKKKRGEKPK